MVWADYEYEGEWKCDEYHGHGVETDKKGNYYEGEFKRGKKYGYGKHVKTDGTVFEGTWIADKMHGIIKVKIKTGKGPKDTKKEVREYRYGEMVRKIA